MGFKYLFPGSDKSFLLIYIRENNGYSFFSGTSVLIFEMVYSIENNSKKKVSKVMEHPVASLNESIDFIVLNITSKMYI